MPTSTANLGALSRTRRCSSAPFLGPTKGILSWADTKEANSEQTHSVQRTACML